LHASAGRPTWAPAAPGQESEFFRMENSEEIFAEVQVDDDFCYSMISKVSIVEVNTCWYYSTDNVLHEAKCG
jgi:hypothetical protein